MAFCALLRGGMAMVGRLDGWPTRDHIFRVGLSIAIC